MSCGFAIIGCSKCRRRTVADLSRSSKTCSGCGAKIDLKKARLLYVSDSAEEAGEVLRKMNAEGNSGFGVYRV